MTAAMPTRKTKKPPTEAETKTGDQPVADGVAAAASAARLAAVKSLIERGKKKGSLTYDEVAAVSIQFDEDDPEKSNELVEEIMAAGIEITDLPHGWLGKNYALHRGAAAATGELIFPMPG